MEFDMINEMKVDELKKYLRLRGLKISGRKVELVARVFSAHENNVKTAVEIEIELSQEYQAKLLQVDYVVPDQYHLTEGWLSEENGIAFWPFVLYPEIYNYLMFNPGELSSSDLNDYKTSKGYSFFSCDWIGAVSYYPINSTSLYCLLKTDCRDSESVNSPPHKLWAIIVKKDAKIKAAHCDCMAGMSGTCLHIAGMLFRVEAAVRNGLTNPSCATKSCEWLPNRKDVVAVKVRDLKLSCDDFGKRGKKSRKLVSTPKKNYDPPSGCNFKPFKLTDIAAALENVIPQSVLFTAVPKPKIDFVREIVTSCVEKPDGLESIDDIIIMSGSFEICLRNVSEIMTAEEVEQIEFYTRGQSSNECWFTFRKGVITGSKGHEVKTKINHQVDM